jgi:hypothetical protein
VENLRRTLILAVCGAALALGAPSAASATALPDARTHVDPAGADADAPKLTFLESDTNAADVRDGYLYIRARCDARCEVEVTATTKVGSKQRQVAKATKTLPANRVRRIKMRIRSEYRQRIANGAKFRFNAVPFPALD